jgi:glycosyltransferase involved in cell wall biosynthesis
MSPTTLYLCYQSVLEPLTQTQVVPYLEGIAQAGVSVLLVTFESDPLTGGEEAEWVERLAAKGVSWHQRRYHKRPTVPATAWDILVGIATGYHLSRSQRIAVVHARAHVPGVMAMVLKGLIGAKFLFDIRGFMAEEYVDAGTWKPEGTLYRVAKRVERALVGAADGIVVLTRTAQGVIERSYPRESSGKVIQVIPCCVELDQAGGGTPPSVTFVADRAVRTLVYVGKLGGWYPTGEMIAFFIAARRRIPSLRWQIFTQSDPAPVWRTLEEWGIEESVSVGRVDPQALPSVLSGASAGLCLYARSRSGAACSPTKVAEYLAAGLPVVSNAGIGDLDGLLSEGGDGRRGPVGVVVRDLSAESYELAVASLVELLEDPNLQPRCRNVAEENFDLRRVGWERYRALYTHLLGRIPSPRGREVPAPAMPVLED